MFMQICDEECEILRKLEESLWTTKTRFDLEYMHRILSPGFFEFGRSGRIYKREDTLAVPSQEIHASLENFAFHPIAEGVILITYLSKVKYEEVEIGNRSSIWCKNDGEWQLRFHQGTPAITKG
jgi:hypothetical protein